MRHLRLAFVVGLLMAVILPAQAQDTGDVQKGRTMAQQVCAECHAVGARDASSPNFRSPTFAEIASTPGMTVAALNAALHTSHTSMPNLILTADQTNDVIAYILSLKK